ncbi:MAG TPA: pYEATS domain-containing protein [Puia sp.]|nr:pYEATS domain-containing protein [Puia sp.]
MPAEANNNSKLVYFFAAIIVAGLIFAGIRLIDQSNEIYQKSIYYMEKSINDSTLKGKPNFAPNYTAVKDGYTESLLYFTLALGVILLVVLLPRLQNISIGATGVNVTLKDLPQKVDALIKQTNDIQAASVGTGGITKATEKDIIKTEELKTTNIGSESYTNDPQKNKWGGLAERNGRKLSATVVPSNSPGYYELEITVASTDDRTPLIGVVKFHLHNTFYNPDPIISALNNKAVLKLTKVYGAFTVGAEADDGQTLLELDLAQDASFPPTFRER